jgi:ATP synthase protein I
MTTDTERVACSQTDGGAVFRRGLQWVIAVAGACLVLSALLAGTPGVYGALLAALLVAAFFSLTAAVLAAAKTLAPATALVLVLAAYTVKIVALAVVFVLVDSAGWLGMWLDPAATALTGLACTLTWMTVHVLTAVRDRRPIYDLRSEP